MYSVGWLVAYITVLLVIAEPCRNIGKYTLGDILAFRNNPKTVSAFMAVSTITVSTFYLTAQMVGRRRAGQDADRHRLRVSVIAVGVLMLGYVVFGGMVATTWVQIIKAMLLVIASLVMVFMYGRHTASAWPELPSGRRRSEDAGAGRDAIWGRREEHDRRRAGPALPRAGPVLKSPIDQISLGMALVLGNRGHASHPDALLHGAHRQAGAHSVIWAMAIIGGFYVLTLFLGTGAAMLVGRTTSWRATAAATWRRRCSRSSWAAGPIRCWAI
jgi:cation/acetate symporter